LSWDFFFLFKILNLNDLSLLSILLYAKTKLKLN
jgi:hypothetical protein